ncbi:BolA/IbaG family iron-sulfur metabolism protein [Actibacterium pelagium]|uniref:BolA family transcriptional regulator n=1 Tax=Actibacterium pelagium TaxID=2029103 RepID=A0A917AE31_9RHOB|nr:BolA family transcriptional regulator [Actibacterium pelagium]GGE45038.1 BolA family transcriptional regulator [Actibacterium pelagium]
MPMQAHEIEAAIRAKFPEATINITDLAGDGNHWAAEVIDESFRGQNRVQQQRAVYAALKDEMAGSNGNLHALALTTKVPE